MAYFIVFFIGILLGMYLQRAKRAPNADTRTYAAPRDVTDAEVEDLVRQGRKLEAIKRYREIHRCDLATASHMVDTFEKILRL